MNVTYVKREDDSITLNITITIKKTNWINVVILKRIYIGFSIENEHLCYFHVNIWVFIY